jgi:hypothetical protein
VDMAAQGRSVTDDVRGIAARQISQQQGLLHKLHLLRMPLSGFPVFVADVTGLSAGILIV